MVLAASMKVSQSLGPPSLPFTLLIRSSHLIALMKCARIIFSPTSPISKHSLLYLVIKSSMLSWSLRHMFKQSAGSLVCIRCWEKCARNFSRKSIHDLILPANRLSNHMRAAPTNV
ncbi:hypothetical protein HanPI659440_Chr08g0309991 [Helianthus annuus]|nr:hypothetical protein HanPI659440_Chr08g0309991 [Helianthus annuus]